LFGEGALGREKASKTGSENSENDHCNRLLMRKA